MTANRAMVMRTKTSILLRDKGFGAHAL